MTQRRSDRRHHVPPSWRDIARRFADDRACLAAFLAMETAEILAGVKPGNLINVVNQSQPCGRNLYALWEKFGPQLVAGCGLRARTLRRRDDALLLFIYHPRLLDKLLAQRSAAALLGRSGYPAPGTREELLDELERRLEGGSFPHEIGIFLGYPLKDVAAFMGWIGLPFACQGPWKIYGDPSASLKLAERHRSCRCRMAWEVASCDDPLLCLPRDDGPLPTPTAA